MEKILDIIEPANEGATVEEVKAKPYTFRLLNATDVFPMATIISKIGVNEFMACFDKEERKKLVSLFQEEAKKSETESHDAEDRKSEDAWSVVTVGIAAVMNVVPVILRNLDKCQKEIYQLLSQTSNLSVEQVQNLGLADFTEMIVDFFKKDEFKDFIKVVSKLFK